MSVLSNFCLAQLHSWSCSIMMTDKNSLSHPDTVFSNLTKPNFSPNCATGFLHLRPFLLSSLVFPSLPILILFMTCAAKRGCQLNNGLSCEIRTLVLFSGNSKSSTLSFHFSHSHFNTTVGHVITLRWSLWDHFKLPHMRESPHLGVLSCSVHSRISR